MIRIEVSEDQAVQLRKMVESESTTIRKRKYPPTGLTIAESYTRLEMAGTVIPQIDQQLVRTNELRAQLDPSEVG